MNDSYLRNVPSVSCNAPKMGAWEPVPWLCMRLRLEGSRNIENPPMGCIDEMKLNKWPCWYEFITKFPRHTGGVKQDFNIVVTEVIGNTGTEFTFSDFRVAYLPEISFFFAAFYLTLVFGQTTNSAQNVKKAEYKDAEKLRWRRLCS